MRVISELIEEAKFDTNVTKSTKFDEAAMLRLFDAAQRQIQMVIFNAYPQDPIFADCKEYAVDGTTNSFKLPVAKMLTPNSIISVRYLRPNGRRGVPMARISIQEVSNKYGYYILDKFIKLTPRELQAGNILEVTYTPILSRIASVDQISELPTICEEYMLMWVEKKIHYIEGSKEVSNSSIFTKQNRLDIVSLFADAARDPKTPPIYNDDYMAY